MIEPKIFYRKLDSILNKIGKSKSGKDFLFTILAELEKTFGDDLNLCNGRIYEEREEEYVLIYPKYENNFTKTLSPEALPVQYLLKNKSYIYDDKFLTLDSISLSQKEYRIPAAFTVHDPDSNWIFAFDLKSGWIREEIEFCLNAVRTALNHRLYSEAVKSDMQQAAYIQQSLLPSSIPQVPGFQIAALSQPAELVGGDLYDFFQFEGDGFGICIGDASGHGLPAALLVRDVVTGLRMGIEKELRMVHTLKKLNRVIYRSVLSTRFVSLVYAEFERNGNLIYANAGHPAPLLIHQNEVKELEATGLIFGALPEIEIYNSFVHMPVGGVLVLYSDGIIERQNRKKEEFGVSRLKQLAFEHQEKDAEEILDIIFSTVLNYGKKIKWEDDASMVVIKRIH